MPLLQGVEIMVRAPRLAGDGSGKFAYLDTQSSLGMIFEVIEPPTGLGEPARRL